MTSHLIFLSVPGLRQRDIDQENTPTLYDWANRGALAELTPTFPCVTSCVQASVFTGRPPVEHGIIANGFYYRDENDPPFGLPPRSPLPPLGKGGVSEPDGNVRGSAPRVEMWTGWNHLIQAPQIWDALRARGLTSAVWHAQNIKGASADFIVTPAPIHEPDGTTKLWCYSKPDGLYQQLLDEIGHFPLQHYWGPLANIESTRWILRAAAWLHQRHAPNFHWIYVPHLDYTMQKHGPNSPQAKAALADLDRELAAFADQMTSSPSARDVVFVVAGEYAMTDVSSVIFPNRILREAGQLAVETREEAEYLDLNRSSAFALVDHQFAHVFVRHEGTEAHRHEVAENVRDHFRQVPGVAAVYAGIDRAQVGMTHKRSGDVILVCEDASWLAYYWWLDDAAAPPFARTVDIHLKPGYDPIELFFDPKTRSIPLDATLIKGSHGVPATGPQHRTALICSEGAKGFASGAVFTDTEIFSRVLELFSP